MIMPKGLLIRALNDDASEVRAEAATIAGKTLEPEEIIDELCRLLKDENSQVRINTALALMKTEALSSITNLQEALSLEHNDQVQASDRSCNQSTQKDLTVKVKLN